MLFDVRRRLDEPVRDPLACQARPGAAGGVAAVRPHDRARFGVLPAAAPPALVRLSGRLLPPT